VSDALALLAIDPGTTHTREINFVAIESIPYQSQCLSVDTGVEASARPAAPDTSSTPMGSICSHLLSVWLPTLPSTPWFGRQCHP